MSLLPRELEELRAGVAAADSLEVKGYPRRSSAVQRLRTVQNIYDRAGVLAHIGFAPDEGYAITDKSSPHGLHELMLISAGKTRRPGLHDHSAAFGKALGVLAECFAAHCGAYDLCPVVSWSYDPDTYDRPSIQGEKRFHAHLVGRTAEERAWVSGHARPAGELREVRRRRIAEEASVLGALLAGDCIDGDALRVLVPVPVLSTPAATTSSLFLVPDGWGALSARGLFEDLVYVHRKLSRIYDEVTGACSMGLRGEGKRPVLDPNCVDQVRLPLSPRSQATLGHYLAGLRPAELETAGSGRDRLTHTYPLAGLAYAVTFAEQQGQVYAHVRTNVFSDLGGAGVTVIDGILTKIRKDVGTLRGDEIAARSSFQADYLHRLRRHPLAGAALFPHT